MLIAVTQSPFVSMSARLDEIAQEIGFTFMSEESLLSACATARSRRYHEFRDSVYSGNAADVKDFHAYACYKLNKGNVITDYRYAALSEMLCLRVLVFRNILQEECAPTQEERKKLVLENMAKQRKYGKLLFEHDLYDVSKYDLFIDASYVSINKAADILKDQIRLFIDGKFERNYWFCTRSIVPTEFVEWVNDQDDSLAVTISDNTVYCLGSNNGLFWTLESNDDIVQVDCIVPHGATERLSKGELYSVEDNYNIEYAPEGCYPITFDLDVEETIKQYMLMYPREGITPEQYLELLKKQYHAFDKPRLASLLYRKWRSWELAERKR